MGDRLFNYPVTVKAPYSVGGALKAKESVNVTVLSRPVETGPARTKSGSAASNPPNPFKLSYSVRPGLVPKDFVTEDEKPALETERRPGNNSKPVYTFCHVLLQMYHYRPSTNSCVSTLNDPARVCNQSPDRFATMEQCRRVCLQNPQHKPQACEGGPLFSVCSRYSAQR